MLTIDVPTGVLKVCREVQAWFQAHPDESVSAMEYIETHDYGRSMDEIVIFAFAHLVRRGVLDPEYPIPRSGEPIRYRLRGEK